MSPARGFPVFLPRQRGTHEKDASAQKCFHNNLSAAAVASHTLLLPAESVLYEVQCLKVICYLREALVLAR